MGLLDLFKNNNKKKEELLALQKLVVDNSPDKLIMSEKQLKRIAAEMAERDLKIIHDCIRILESTTNSWWSLPECQDQAAHQRTASSRNGVRSTD